MHTNSQPPIQPASPPIQPASQTSTRPNGPKPSVTRPNRRAASTELQQQAERRQMKIIVTVCSLMSLPAAQLLGRNRNHNVSAARGICFYLMRENLQMSYGQIGAVFGKQKDFVWRKTSQMETCYKYCWYPQYNNVIDVVNAFFQPARTEPK